MKSFEVFSRDNQRVFYTSDKECVPPKNTIEALIRDEYKIKIDGKSLYKKDIGAFAKSLGAK